LRSIYFKQREILHKTERQGSENLNQKKNRKEENENEINVSIKVTGLYPYTLTNKQINRKNSGSHSRDYDNCTILGSDFA
jgi:hypothetical protein